MKKKQIEKLLKAEIEQNVPFVLPKVLQTPYQIEEVQPEVKKTESKPYFRFRYLYVSLCMFAVLVVGIGVFLPDINSKYIADKQTEDIMYIVTTNIMVNDYVINITSDSNNKVLNLKVYNNNVTFISKNNNLTNVTNAIKEAVDVLIQQNAFTGVQDIILETVSTKSDSKNSNFNSVKISLNNVLKSKGLNYNIVKK